MSTYEKVLHAIDDGDWHRREVLADVTPFLDDWLEELRREGHVIVEEDGSVRLVSEQPDETRALARV